MLESRGSRKNIFAKCLRIDNLRVWLILLMCKKEDLIMSMQLVPFVVIIMILTNVRILVIRKQLLIEEIVQDQGSLSRVRREWGESLSFNKWRLLRHLRRRKMIIIRVVVIRRGRRRRIRSVIIIIIIKFRFIWERIRGSSSSSVSGIEIGSRGQKV